MLLRRITQHVRNQNWFAVCLDFLIVVFGVYIGLQVQDWAVEKKRLKSERQYLERLHDEVEQLAMTREVYNESRVEFSQHLFEITEILNETNQEIELTHEHCRTIAHSSFTTIPPAELPSATELISSGRLDQIASSALRNSILGYIQDVARSRDLITAISDDNVSLSRAYPLLLKTKVSYAKGESDLVDLTASCNASDLRSNQSFINDFGNNAFVYVIYTNRAVLKVSEKLSELHAVLDKTLGINHPEKEVQ